MNLIWTLLTLGMISVLIICDAPLAIAQDGTTATDSTDEFLIGDPGWENVATVPPAIDFRLVPLAGATSGFTHWCNIVLGPDRRFYFAIGDHAENGTVLLIAYDPASRTDEICINSDFINGLEEGKWHGRPDINPNNGDLFLLGFFNGDLIRYNIYSKQTFHLGKPVDGEGFPEHTWDWQRNRLYAVGHTGKLLVYDTENYKVIFHDNPPNGLNWNDRARLLDRESGYLYGTDQFYTFLRYNPAENTISPLKANLEDGSLRAWTNRRENDGSFWISSDLGFIYRFIPEQDKLEFQGENLGDGSYITFIERSPGGRYLYYTAARLPNEGKIVQFDTETNQKKIIAFLKNYYSENYNFEMTGSYGGALSIDGSSLFLVSNGYWGDNERPAMFNIRIPPVEREGDPASLNPPLTIPSGIQLLQNYPNPFNPETTIEYHLSESGPLSLSIITTGGQLVRVLEKSYKTPGIYKTNVSMSGYASGIYIYQLDFNDYRLGRKMIYLK